MSITVRSSVFRKARDLAGSIVERRTTIPTLSCLLVQAEDGRLTITGTDMDIDVSVRLDADITYKKRRAFAMPWHEAAARAMRVSEADEVIFTVEDVDAGAALGLTSGLLKMSGATLPAAKFPSEPLSPQPLFAATLGTDFLGALRRVYPAVSTEETRYYLSGVFMHKGEGDWAYKLVATDGHRLNASNVVIPDASGDLGAGHIIPKKAVSALLKMTDKIQNGSVRMTIHEKGKIRFAFDVGDLAVEFITKTIDGTFPDYKRVIPQGNDKLVTFKVEELSRAVATFIAAGSKEKGPGICFDFEAGTATMNKNWTGDALGTINLNVPYQGEIQPLRIGFNGKYMLSSLGSLGREATEVTLNFKDATSPTILMNPNDTNFQSVIMPMRV